MKYYLLLFATIFLLSCAKEEQSNPVLLCYSPASNENLPVNIYVDDSLIGVLTESLDSAVITPDVEDSRIIYFELEPGFHTVRAKYAITPYNGLLIFGDGEYEAGLLYYLSCDFTDSLMSVTTLGEQ